MNGQVRLKWSSHQGTMMSMLDRLLEAESFIDVKLACEGKILKAHKVILSACSPFFQEMLLTEPISSEPIIYMKDVKYNDLKALIDFIYRGEVNIGHDDLPAFLTLAEDLQIRGLANRSEENSPSKLIRKKFLSGASNKHGCGKGIIEPMSSHPPPLKRAREVTTAEPQINNLTFPVLNQNEDENGEDTMDNVDNSQNFESEELEMEPNNVYVEQDQSEIQETEVDPEEEEGGNNSGGLVSTDWRDVLNEDEEDSMGQFSLSDPDGWAFGDNDKFGMMGEEDDENEVFEPGQGSSRSADSEPSFCPLCNKGFAKRKTWNTHCLYDCPMVEPKYSCPHCEYRARRGYQLKIHCLKIHGIGS